MITIRRAGEVKVNGQLVKHGDGVALSNEANVSGEGTATGEVIVFDLG